MKELKRLFTRKMIHRRVFSSLLAMLLVITSVIHPINVVPVYATSNWLRVNYQEQAKDELEIYVQAESANFEPGETIVLDLFLQNHSEHAFTDFCLSLRDDKDAFSESAFILPEDCDEAIINEKGSITNLNLAPGETKAFQFEGTLDNDLDALDRREIRFFCGGYDENGTAVTATKEFQFIVGLFDELSIDFTDGTELIPNETNTIEIIMGLNDLGYYYETEVATDSNASVVTDADTEVATDSDAELATDSDADIDDEYVFDLTGVTLDLETVGVKFQNVKLKDVAVSEENGTITALVSYNVDEDAEPGEYFGTLKANIKNGKKTYVSETAFQFEVAEVTDGIRKKAGLFTAELENFTVKVEVADGAFDEKVELVVTELAEDSEEFKTAEAAMENHDREFDGMMALDICFINEAGEEVEPNEGYSVQVSIEMNAEMLPEGIDTESLMVHHIAETTTDDVQAEVELKVEDVADTADATAGIVEVKEVDEAPVVAAEFKVEGFSTFTITWINNGTNILNVIYATEASDDAVLNLDNMPNQVSITADSTFSLKKYAPKTTQYTNDDDSVEGYVFSSAVLISGSDTKTYTDITQDAIRWNQTQGRLEYYDNGWYNAEWKGISNDAKLYLIYRKYNKLPSTELEETVDTRGLIKIDLTDFSDSTTSIGSGDDTFIVGQSKSGWMNSWTNAETVNGKRVGKGVVQGIVNETLVDGYPVLNAADSPSLEKFFAGSEDDSSIQLYSDCNYLFKLDSDGYYTYDSSKNFAHLTQAQDGENNFEVYKYPHYDPESNNFDSGDHPQFLPFDDITGSKVNASPSYYSLAGGNNNPEYLFGMMVGFEFIMPKDGLIDGNPMIFSFSGDDDVWVFVDNKLVLDMGGVHLSHTGSINFATGVVSVDRIHTDNNKAESISVFDDYTKHTLKFFYMERGKGGSNCNLRFNIQPIPQKSLTVTKELITGSSASGETDVVKEYIKSSVNYKFRVMEVVNGAVTEDLYVPAGTKYTLLENGTVVETTTPLEVDDDGYFYLKAGHSARFDNMLAFNNNVPGSYVVQEIMPDGITGQYNGVEYVVNGAGGEIETGDVEISKESFTSFTSGALANDETQYVIYNNKVDTNALSGLKVTKKVAPSLNIDKDATFQIKIDLGNDADSVKAVPAGTKYMILDANGNVVKDGEGNDVRTFGTDDEGNDTGIVELQDGQSVIMVDGILAGTHYRISEVISDGQYRASYTGKIESPDDNRNDPSITANGVIGEFKPGDSLYVTVINSNFEFATELPIRKTTEGFEKTESESRFEFEVSPCDASGEPKESAFIGSTIVVPKNNPDTNTIEGTIIFGGTTGTCVTDNTYYFKINEKIGADKRVDYDKTVYIVGVSVSNGIAKVVSLNGNDYAGETLDFVNYYDNTTEVTISKQVTGNLGDWKKEFTFTARLENGTFPTEYVAYLTDDTTKATEVGYEIKSDNSVEITLQHNETIKLKLPVGLKLTVEETIYDGYVTTNTINGISSTDSYKAVISTLVKNDTPVEIIFTNNNDAKPDTGISMDTLPYILIMLAVIGGIVFTIIRKRKDDDLD